MIKIAVEGDRANTANYRFVGAMDSYDPMIMGRTMKTDFTEAAAQVNGQNIEFDIYESPDFATEFRFVSCDAYILLADPKHFSATEYATNLQYILNFQKTTADALPIVLVAVGKLKGLEKLSKFAAEHHISFAHLKDYDQKDEIRKIFINVLEKVLPNLGTDRLTTRPPKQPIMMKPKHRDLPEMRHPQDQKKKI